MVEKITYGGIEYAVRFPEVLYGPDGEEKLGYCNFREETIAISRNQGVSQQRITLLHELIHIIDVHAGLDLNENRIEAIARAMYELESVNPKLWGETVTNGKTKVTKQTSVTSKKEKGRRPTKAAGAGQKPKSR